MGLCVSHDRDNQRRRSHSSRSSATTSGTFARNKPLNHSACRPKWKSDVPITENQLRRKREEYWDTAPAFEGRKEIWDALRGACYAIEQNDIDLAQSILNCANISLPHGTLLDCYDELGTRYQIPIYILSSPTNLIDIEQTSINENESGTSDFDLIATNLIDRERDFSDNQQHTNCKLTLNDHTNHHSIVYELKKHRRKIKSNSINDTNENDSSSSTIIIQQKQLQTNTNDIEIEIPIKFRLSNGKEHRLYCKSNEKFRNIKRRLAMLENGVIDYQIQRLFFGGKLLRDRMTIGETRLQRNFVVQVILQDQPLPANGAITTTVHLTRNHDHVDYSTPIQQT